MDEKLDALIKDPSGETPNPDCHGPGDARFFIYMSNFCSISSSGWWLVENENKSLAWFPAPYLELWDGEEDDFAGSQLGGMALTRLH